MTNYIKPLFIAMSFALCSCATVGAQKPVKPEMVIGDISSHQLLSRYTEFSQAFRAFQLSGKERERVNTWPEGITIDVYFGSWCHDSAREVPRLLKALNKKVTINLIGIDYLKSEPQGRALKANVKFTPTFIVYLNNKELGRIIERPKVSLVADIDNLIKKEAV